MNTLYINRPLLNHEMLRAWARLGGHSIPEGIYLHVTVAYSKAPLLWPIPQTEDLTVVGGERKIVLLGGNAVALQFESQALWRRHASLLARGASWDFEEYAPHITIGYERHRLPISLFDKPFPGDLVLGPEVHAKVPRT